jgi:hypothetical protein
VVWDGDGTSAPHLPAPSLRFRLNCTHGRSLALRSPTDAALRDWVDAFERVGVQTLVVRDGRVVGASKGGAAASASGLYSPPRQRTVSELEDDEVDGAGLAT